MSIKPFSKNDSQLATHKEPFGHGGCGGHGHCDGGCGGHGQCGGQCHGHGHEHHKNDYLVGSSYYEPAGEDYQVVPSTLQVDKDTNTYQMLSLYMNGAEDVAGDVKNHEKHEIEIKRDDGDDDDNKYSNIHMNYATQFYLGSLTVVGLFILFRMIQKTR